MKKVIVLLGFLFFSFTILNAGESDLFTYDSVELDEMFSNVSIVEDYLFSLEQFDSWSFEDDEILSNKIAELKGPANPSSVLFSIDDIDGPSFAWGLFCFPVGFFIVLFDTDSSRNDKISYFLGLGTCFSSVACYGILNVFLIGSTMVY